jgi:hypothetical protein
MKTSLCIALAATLILTPVAFAQSNGSGPRANSYDVQTDRTPGGQPSNNSTNSSGNSANNGQNPNNSDANNINQAEHDDVWQVASKLLNSDSLNVDTENGVFQWNNSKFSVGDNLVVRSRFERYLSSPGFDDTGDYQQVLDKIQELLTTNTAATQDDAVKPVEAGNSDKIYQAWQLLYKAAKYDEDGGASQTLANQVFNAWRVRDELDANKAAYNELDAARQRQEFNLATSGTQAASDAVNFARQNPGLTGSTPRPGQVNGNGLSGGSGGNNSSGTQTTGRGTTSGNTSENTSGNTSGNSSGGLLSGVNPYLNVNLSNNSLVPGGSPSGGASTSPPPDALPGLQKASVAGLQSEELSRTYVQQSLLDADATTMGLEAKLEFQTQLFAFIAQRRFQHSLIAGMFYEHVFKGSQQRMNVAATEMSKFFNTDSIVPSVNNFELISHEAINETENGMKSVENAYDRGDRWIALQQLQQTFLLGENLPPVQNFDPAKRHVLLAIYTESTALKHMMEDRDFAGAEGKLNQIEADAKDFADADAAPIMSAIKEGEQISNNYVMAAEQAALTSDIDRVTANLQKATEMWPLNPEIASFSKSLRDHSNQANVGTGKFDDLLAHGDERAIFDNKDEIGAALYGDAARSAKFKEIVDRESQVEVAVNIADQAVKQNNGYYAWETLVNATKIEPNDPVLAITKAQVAARVAPFVAALDSADRAEQAGDYPASLNYYLQAQDIYPASQICHDAIEELSLKIMAKLNPGGASAKALSIQGGAAAPAPSVPAHPAQTPAAGSPTNSSPAS